MCVDVFFGKQYIKHKRKCVLSSFVFDIYIYINIDIVKKKKMYCK